MVLTIIINVVLAAGILVMVITPLALAIRKQRRDDPTPVAAARPAQDAPGARTREPSRGGSQPAYNPVVGRT